jgi:hypothetical protein
MEEILKELTPAILSIATVILTFVARWLAVKLAKILDTQAKREIVEATVKYVEQVAKSVGLDAEGKKALAIAKASEWLIEKGLPVSEVELDVMIEAAVNDFFGHYNRFELFEGKSGGQNEPVEAQVE